MHPLSREYLLEFLSEEMQKTEGKTAIMSGHQVVRTANSYEDLGVFPKITWDIGWNLIQQARRRHEEMQIFALINDWQCIRGTQAVDNDGTDMKSSYWNNAAMALQEIQDTERKQMLLAGLPIGTVKYDDDLHRGRLSESRLQNQFSQVLQRQPERRKVLQEAMAELGVSQSGTCHVAGCTSEYLQLVPNLWEQGYRKIISFIPSACRQFITAAGQILETEFFQKRSHEKGKILNVYMPSGFMGTLKPKSEADLFANKQTETEIFHV